MTRGTSGNARRLTTCLWVVLLWVLSSASAGEAMGVTMTEPVRRFILAHPVARLATADAKGQPHVIPFCYAFDGEQFYFVVDEKPKRQTGKPLKRLRNILENPQVALVIDDYADDWTQLAYVLVTGTARLVADQHEYERALALLRARYPQYRHMELSFSRNPIVRITPTKVHAWGKIE
ncbi:MAG: TIGR03668 family PPOX class F420-dependent oxidoreductase [Candidatus Binatia bacterium]|nr:TIGR03668 family PPOX class F420-dependent oxidoreductase [Candidatus Binatia bacterium]